MTYFGQDRNHPSPGQVTVEFGRLEYQAQDVRDATASNGDRWSAGLDYWSTLDTNATLEFEPTGANAATLRIRWGTYHLTAPVTVHLPNK